MSAKYSIGEFAKKTGITIRALHYYDEIDLLKPTFISNAGRRYYSDANIIQLQKIVTLKFLGYSLEKIHELIHLHDWDLQESLQFQKQEMIQKREHLDRVIRALDHALFMMEEQGTVNANVFMTLIHNIHKEDEQKVWLKNYFPKDAVDEMYSLSEEKQMELNSKMAQLINELKTASGQDPTSTSVQALIEQYFALALEVYPGTIELVQELGNQEIDIEMDNSTELFPSPFSQKEEEWITQVLQYYLDKKGVNIHGED
ncbi:MerR family transcriptional regulator [Solibacillus sp. CAU 1738]|uniref:MerR family transcriptional regulator n=1 Tax=Solibacillus sp. CAU 1738 TaxID=3140363 RepID=UPI00325FF329